MTLKIKELIIRAEISENENPKAGTDQKDGSAPVGVSSETNALTTRFYEEDLTKGNER